MHLKCGVGEDSWESLGLQGDPTSQDWFPLELTGRTDAEADAPILWPPDAKNWLIGRDPDTGKDWRQEEKGMTEDEMVGCHHQLDGHEFEQTLEVGNGQWTLVWWSTCGHKESDMTEWLNWTDALQFTISSIYLILFWLFFIEAYLYYFYLQISWKKLILPKI